MLDYIDLDADLELEEKIEDVREATEADTTRFPLRVLLTIYMRTYPLCYIEYHKGLVALMKFLQPIDFGHSITPIPYRRLPEQLRSWEINELAKIIGCSEELIFYTILSIHIG